MEANLAVLIDFENIAAGTEKEGLGRFDVDALMKRVKDKGRILVARSYADWGRFARFKQSLLTANVTMYELTSHGMQDKNRADIAMVVDALELAFHRDYIDTFVVVSGDSDFTPLVLKMRELNKRVIGVGTRSSTSRLLIQACDEFIFYDSIVNEKRSRTRRAPSKPGGRLDLEAAFDLLLEAVQGLQREEPDPPLASVVKTAILRKYPDFTESEYNFSSFARFLEAAQRKGRCRIFRDQKSGGYRVDLTDGEGSTSESTPGKSADNKAEETGLWMDPYAPKGSGRYIEVLSGEGFNPMAAPTRLALLEHLEQATKDRTKRRRRINAQFVQEDVRKRMRKTHPDVPSRAIRSIFNALLRAQVFIHRDGTPVRSGLAPFNLTKSAEELNTALANVYLELLEAEDVDLSDSATLAELLFGDRERRRAIEEIVAWLLTSATPDDDDDDEDEDEDFDRLLTIEPSEGAVDEDEDDALDALLTMEPESDAPNGGDDEGRAQASDAADPAVADEVEIEKTEAKVEKKTRAKASKKTKAKASKKTEAEAEAPDGDTPPDAEEAVETAEKRAPTRRRTRKKRKTDDTDDPSLDDLLTTS